MHEKDAGGVEGTSRPWSAPPTEALVKNRRCSPRVDGAGTRCLRAPYAHVPGTMQVPGQGSYELCVQQRLPACASSLATSSVGGAGWSCTSKLGSRGQQLWHAMREAGGVGDGARAGGSKLTRSCSSPAAPHRIWTTGVEAAATVVSRGRRLWQLVSCGFPARR